MPGDISAGAEPGTLAARVRHALESGDLDAMRDLLAPGARWGPPDRAEAVARAGLPA